MEALVHSVVPRIVWKVWLTWPIHRTYCPMRKKPNGGFITGALCHVHMANMYFQASATDKSDPPDGQSRTPGNKAEN